ncbi:MAG: hypothetical protein ACYCXF_02135 [Thermoleophilia bacterium]
MFNKLTPNPLVEDETQTIQFYMKLLTHNKVYIRFLALWPLCLILLFLSWFISFRFLPEGILTNKLPSAGIGLGSGGFTLIFIKIFFFNLVVAGGILTFANLFQVGRLPLGYVPIMVQWIGFGIFLGTNSFSVPMIERAYPSFRFFVSSPGAFELTALTLLVASTAGIGIYRQASWLGVKTYKLKKLSEIHLGMTELAMILIAVILLFIGNWKEASSILQSAM